MFNPWKLSALWGKRRVLTPFDVAVLALERGEHEDAYRRLSELLDAAPLSASQRAAVHNKRGVALVNMHRKSEALSDFSAALDLQPALCAALVNVGNILLEDGNIQEAIVRYHAAVRADDTYALAHFNLGAAYKKLGRHDEAVRELRTANRLEGRPPPKGW
ncbi:MAG: tetratricopeptide repeat protein [Candidatus Eremiobacteraeota bacterium]|nr:tetratricopeptide repeat protein [Candidatus Eremiobacteraeota bacterium]